MNTSESNGDQPTTQHDLSLLAGEMSRRFDGNDRQLNAIESRLTAVEQRLTHIDRGQQSLLQLVGSIDNQLRAWRDIPDKLERVHRKLFPHG